MPRNGGDPAKNEHVNWGCDDQKTSPKCQKKLDGKDVQRKVTLKEVLTKFFDLVLENPDQAVFKGLHEEFKEIFSDVKEEITHSALKNMLEKLAKELEKLKEAKKLEEAKKAKELEKLKEANGRG